MHQKSLRLLTVPALAVATLAASAAPVLAHHVMGGGMPAGFTDGFLSGLGHPVIGLDHFAAVLAVGCIAAAFRAGAALVVAFVLAMMAGVGVHVHGTALPGGEILVASTVVGLGLLMFWHKEIPATAALALFAAVGFIHGHALGETIYGAEPTPLYAYLAGLAVIQAAIALAAMHVARALSRRGAPVGALRLVGIAIAGFGVVLLIPQV